MKLVSGIVDSGFFAQSALSAEVATKDSLGRNISETYLTGVDLTPYQTVEGMTAYQSAGDYLTTADSANFYTTANESGFITSVPDTYLQNTDLSTEDGKVTAISGIPLSAGGDVPEGVMVESGLEYNAVDEISGYNGSAFAQYGAEKQWLVHDDTLVHASNSAQYALGVNLSAVAQLLGVDETVLWENTTPLTATGQQFVLSEPFSSFSKLKFVMSMDQTKQDVILEPAGNYFGLPFSYIKINNAAYESWSLISFTGAKTGSILSTKCLAWNLGSTAKQANDVYNNWEWTTRALTKIVGIGRKEV